MNTDEELRWFRAALISSEKFPKMMSAMIMNSTPPNIVHNLINKNSTFLNELQSKERETVKTLKTCGFAKFDTTLMYRCIRFFQLVDRPSEKWGNLPLSESAITQGDDVERMKSLRNKTFHVAEAKLNTNEFIQFIEICNQIACRLDRFLHKYRNGFQDEIRKIEQRSIMDASTHRNYVSLLEECVCLRQVQSTRTIGNFEVTIYYGKDVTGQIGCETNADDKYIMYISGPNLDDDEDVKKLLENISKKIGNIKVSKIERGSIILHVNINKKAFSTKSGLNNSLYKLLEQLFPYFADYGQVENKIEVRLCVDDYPFGEITENLSYLSDSTGKENYKFAIDLPRSVMSEPDALHDVIFDSAEEVLGNLPNENETNKKTQLDVVLTTQNADNIQKYTALRNFNYEDNSYLDVVAGDTIHIVGREDHGWFQGKMGNKKGLVPASYVHRQENQNVELEHVEPQKTPPLPKNYTQTLTKNRSTHRIGAHQRNRHKKDPEFEIPSEFQLSKPTDDHNKKIESEMQKNIDQINEKCNEIIKTSEVKDEIIKDLQKQMSQQRRDMDNIKRERSMERELVLKIQTQLSKSTEDHNKRIESEIQTNIAEINEKCNKMIKTSAVKDEIIEDLQKQMSQQRRVMANTMYEICREQYNLRDSLKEHYENLQKSERRQNRDLDDLKRQFETKLDEMKGRGCTQS